MSILAGTCFYSQAEMSGELRVTIMALLSVAISGTKPVSKRWDAIVVDGLP